MPIDVFMTQLSPTMTEGRIARWLKKEGDVLTSGEVLAEIETDKATMEMEVVDEGTLYRIIAPEGAVVPVGAPIAVIAGEGEKVAANYVPVAEAAPAAEVAAEEKAEPAAAKGQAAPAMQRVAAPQPAVVPQPAAAPAHIKASPLARRLARQMGVDLAAVQGSGPGGRIIKADIARAAKKGISLGLGAVAAAAPPLRPLPAGPLPYHEDEYERVENSMMRRAIARRLVESKQQVPHFYLTIDVNADRLLDLRAQLNEAAEGAFKLSVNDFIIKAVSRALVDVPAANSTWTDEATLRHKHTHISVAVAMDSGLITPVVRYAERKGVVEISTEVKELAGRAREGKLQPEEYTGGTFTVSNLGMYGIRQFAAIVNPPEGAILAVGGAEERALAVDGEIRARQMMTLTLSCDHRVVDGVIGAEFLAALKKHLETPASVLI